MIANDNIRHLVRRLQPLEYFPNSDATTVANRVLPPALPSIWNCINSLSADGTITLDTNFMKSSDLTINDFVVFLKGCGLTLTSTNPIRIKDENITEMVAVAVNQQEKLLTSEQIEDILK